MPEPCAPVLPPERGERLIRADYRQDFQRRDAEIRDGSSWKLERRQHFEELGNDSREALRHGDWEGALRLLAGRRDRVRAEALEDRRRGHAFHRVRVVETPLTPYLQWELHSLNVRAECGERIRVIGAETVAPAETRAPLPELVVLDGGVLYNVVYTEAGVPDGAVRFTDAGLVGPWESYIKELYDLGEDLRTYFDREVAHLPPPTRQPTTTPE
jgi:hypothetical protein